MYLPRRVISSDAFRCVGALTIHVVATAAKQLNACFMAVFKDSLWNEE
jgi:hypothetical protein